MNYKLVDPRSNVNVIETAISNAINDSVTTCYKWGAPVNREDRAAGGHHWSTYKAICRRNGIYKNAQGPHVSHCCTLQMDNTMLNDIFPGMERSAVSTELKDSYDFLLTNPVLNL